MHVLKPYKKCLHLLRKRRKDSTSDDNSQNDNQSSTKMDTPVKNARRDETLTENVMKDILNTTDSDTKKCQYSKDSYINKEEDPTVMKHNNKDNKIMSDSQKSLISVRKIEDLCKTPQKNNVSNNLENTENIKEENINSPNISSPFISNINSLEWNSQSIKSLLETPMACKKEMHDFDNNTPNRQKKRKFSLDVSDIDQMSDPLKLEFLPDMEAIDMLHDLNSIIDFEDIKIPPDIFTSTANNTMHNEYDVEISKDPLTDPLYITSNDEHDLTAENVNYKNKRKRIKNPRSTNRQVKNEESSAQHNAKSAEKSKPDTNYLKDILGELDIELESETENEEKTFEPDLRKLYNLQVKIIHDVPKQHTIEHTSGTRALTRSEKQLFLEYGPIKSGTFSPKEDKIILNNWKTFCEIHEWDPKHVKPFICMKYGTKFYMRTKEQRRKFVQFLGNGLPWRPLFSIYRRFRYLHEDHAKSFTRYTLYEDQQILSHMKKKKKKKKSNTTFAELAKMLGRSSHSIRLRYKLLKKMRGDKKKNPLSEVTWTLSLVGEFIKSFVDITLCENVIELKDASIPKVVWLKLEEKLNIDHDVLKLFWIYQLHMQLFCPEPIYLNDIKIKLIEYIYEKGIGHTREIIWPKVAKFFDGITTIFLCKTFCNLVAEASTKLDTSNFSEIIEYLYIEKIPEIQNERTDKFLPRLSYGNGKVKIIDKDPPKE
nr:DNA-binding protein REB1-like isoform X2 [Osmia lignaria]XP_034185778.1 DNA-binding protein REB1-like isoform X2 [Osmia lignaria]XP_034185779.1 DNA-binding protein REB1-like isoform X2 [Osmia lignaria]XP_034185780.1 DNA-binding protein REB1-like isoform X2 [Osmia lignaria]XP_034185781.1 DNA-binding protein REB1-like isoform X2 [Osmia lignaria]